MSENPAQNPKLATSWAAGLVALGLMFFVCCGLCSGVLTTDSGSGSTAAIPADRSLDAARFAEGVVSGYLKYPDDAHFPLFGAVARETGITNLWLVTGTVKAKNVLGLELTQRWRVRMMDDSGGWRLLSCEIDGEPVYGDPFAVPGR